MKLENTEELIHQVIILLLQDDPDKFLGRLAWILCTCMRACQTLILIPVEIKRIHFLSPVCFQSVILILLHPHG